MTPPALPQQPSVPSTPPPAPAREFAVAFAEPAHGIRPQVPAFSFRPGIAPAFSGAGAPADADLVPVLVAQPMYPRHALRSRIEGSVRLEIVVNPDGTVREARVIDAEPAGVFEAAALQAALRSRFRPRMVAGEPVESRGRYDKHFRLAP